MLCITAYCPNKYFASKYFTHIVAKVVACCSVSTNFKDVPSISSMNLFHICVIKTY